MIRVTDLHKNSEGLEALRGLNFEVPEAALALIEQTEQERRRRSSLDEHSEPLARKIGGAGSDSRRLSPKEWLRLDTCPRTRRCRRD